MLAPVSGSQHVNPLWQHQPRTGISLTNTKRPQPSLRKRPPRKGRPAALAVSPFPNGAAIREKGEGAKRLRGLYAA
ncbi:hypothetical protein CLU86_2590 [Acidovorax sp. 62]|nr:hypothetical protein CLU86_2590 [Acidovorax sp. 62]